MDTLKEKRYKLNNPEIKDPTKRPLHSHKNKSKSKVKKRIAKNHEILNKLKNS